MTIDTKQ